MHAAIVGIIASRDSNSVPVPGADYLTSTLYPIAVDESLLVGLPQFLGEGELFQNPADDVILSTPTIESGVLQATIVYQTYNNWQSEPFLISTPEITGGTLQATIAYQTYNNWQSEPFLISTPEITGGTLTTTIAYVTYNNWQTDRFELSTPSIESGTLT